MSMTRGGKLIYHENKSGYGIEIGLSISLNNNAIGQIYWTMSCILPLGETQKVICNRVLLGRGKSNA
jgi:hypothetical protein